MCQYLGCFDTLLPWKRIVIWSLKQMSHKLAILMVLVGKFWSCVLLISTSVSIVQMEFILSFPPWERSEQLEPLQDRLCLDLSYQTRDCA